MTASSTPSNGRRARGARLGLVLAGLALMAAAPAKRARPPAPVRALVPVPAPIVEDDGETRARQQFDLGQRAYDVGDFKEALDLFSSAYKAKPLPGLLFNIGQCQRQLGKHKEATFVFGRFIDTSGPDDANLPLARQFIAEQRRLEAKDAPVLTPLVPAPGSAPVAVAATPGEKPVYARPWFWGVVGGAVLAVAATSALVVMAKPARTFEPTSLADIPGR